MTDFTNMPELLEASSDSDEGCDLRLTRKRDPLTIDKVDAMAKIFSLIGGITMAECVSLFSDYPIVPDWDYPEELNKSYHHIWNKMLMTRTSIGFWGGLDEPNRRRILYWAMVRSGCEYVMDTDDFYFFHRMEAAGYYGVEPRVQSHHYWLIMTNEKKNECLVKLDYGR